MGLEPLFYVKIFVFCLACKVRCYGFKELAYPIESCIKFLKDTGELHTTPPICSECNGSMEEGKGNGISKKSPPPGYSKEYLCRERKGRDEPTTYIKILSHIAGINRE